MTMTWDDMGKTERSSIRPRTYRRLGHAHRDVMGDINSYTGHASLYARGKPRLVSQVSEGFHFHRKVHL